MDFDHLDYILGFPYLVFSFMKFDHHDSVFDIFFSLVSSFMNFDLYDYILSFPFLVCLFLITFHLDSVLVFYFFSFSIPRIPTITTLFLVFPIYVDSHFSRCIPTRLARLTFDQSEKPIFIKSWSHHLLLFIYF